MVLLVSGCASTPYYGVTPGGAAMLNYSAQMLNGGGGGFGYAQPARMPVTCIKQGPWTNCY